MNDSAASDDELVGAADGAVVPQKLSSWTGGVSAFRGRGGRSFEAPFPQPTDF